ncbi:SLBB domain-containing protein [bacterium]|nr:SLBB domain-containing protein [bacterium]
MCKIKPIVLMLMVIIVFQATADGSDVSDYVIGVDDVLEVVVLGKGDYRFTEETTVSSTGRILLSLMQDEFRVSELTISQATQNLEKLLAKDYLRDPKVIIDVKLFNSQKVLLIGEVKKPGEVILKSSSLGLKQLVIEAGGPTGGMAKTVILVNEGMEPGSVPEAFSLDELLLSSQHDSVRVKSGDIIYVLGRDKQLPIADLGNVVYVFGHVGKPGIIPFSRKMTVLRAIINAGNFTKEAAPGRTTVKRKEEEKISTIKVNLEQMMSGGDKTIDIELKPGDVVYVPRSIF